MIIGISGKIGSGKDTIGRIIQYLTCPAMGIQVEMKDWINKPDYNNFRPDWQIVKFADALKDVICILTGCTKEQLEDENFKNNKLPDEWIRYGYADGFFKYYKNGKEETKMNNVQCDKERYELEYRTNWETAYKVHPTYRELLQYIGTDLLRNQLHENVWVNALLSKYNKTFTGLDAANHFVKNDGTSMELHYPNWIITDVRFPNEAKAIKDIGGIIIRVNRLIEKEVYIIENEQPFKNWYGVVESYNGNGFYNVVNGADDVILVHKNQIILQNEHESEKALDNAEFDYVIDNNGTIEELIEHVNIILTKEQIV